jgi:hypothetical protein
MISTVAGISRTVRPSRLALDATPLVFSGDCAAVESDIAGVGAATGPTWRRTARPDVGARFDADCVLLTGL